MPFDPRWEQLKTVRGEPLTDDELARLLSRLPDLEEAAMDEVAFLRREDSLPVPLTGDTIREGWPPDLSRLMAAPTHQGPLKVQAFRPDGEVTPPFQLAVAFDRPMVALGAVGDRPTPEVSITPEVAGRWRWLGTQTLAFQPEGDFPRATEFTVEVAAGAEAVDGERLPEAHAFSFATPPPKVLTIQPQHGPHATDAPVLVVFDQPVPEDMADRIRVRDGRRTIPMTTLTGDARTEAFGAYHGPVIEGRAIVLAPQREYRDSATVEITVGTPIRSLEGPRLGTEGHSSTFRVRGPMRFEELQCGWGGRCYPGQSVMARFTNGLAHDLELSPGDFDIRPPVEDLSVSVGGQFITFQGDFQPRTTYRITLPDGLRDQFGQSLQGSRRDSITIGPHPPMVAGPNSPMVVRPTAEGALLPIAVAEVASLRKRIYRVTPEHWSAYTSLHYNRWSDDFSVDLPLVSQEVLRFGRRDRQHRQDLTLDLREALGGQRTGHAVVVLDEIDGEHMERQRFFYWVQVTDLAADVTDDGREVQVKVTTISDGSPVDGARLSAGSHRTTTNAAGEASLPRLAGESIVIERGGDVLLVPAGGSVHGPGYWNSGGDYTNLVWGVIDDRKMYRPGETVTIRGWIRERENTPRSDLEPTTVNTVRYRVYEPRSNEIADGEVELDRFGGFELTVEIPDGANLGHAWVQFEAQGTGHASTNFRHSFEIQEFRRPEYEVTLESDAGPHLAEGNVRWEALASYYAGGALPGAPATWRFSEVQASYSPPGWSGYSFGAWSPWWWHRHHYGGGNHGFEALPQDYISGLSGRTTDASGRDVLSVELNRLSRGLPRRLTATVSVQDVNRQAWEASDTVLVHPGQAYVGVKAHSTFIQRDESFEVDLVAVDLDGDALIGRPIEITVERTRWGSDDDAPQTCQRTSAADPVTCSFSDLTPGSYRLTAVVTDDQDRQARTELQFWVAGQDRTGAETAEEGELQLIPDQEKYEVGDTARLFVQSPTYPLNAIVELRRDGRYDRRIQRITAEDPVVEIDLEESMLPNVHVAVIALSAGAAYEPGEFLSGRLNLPVQTTPRQLTVDVKPSASQVAPGAEIGVEVQVRDHQGAPVRDTQVLLFAVDEAVLSLSGYTLRDMVQAFYPTRQAAVQDVRSRSWLLLGVEPPELGGAGTEGAAMEMQAFGAAGSAPAPMARRARSMVAADMAPSEDAPAAIALREVFDALAFFRSDLVTDADGVVRVDQKLPESLTRYRVMAIAVDDGRRFGGGEENVTARMPLMVRPSAPRFLNVGDVFEFPLVIQNQTSEPMEVDVAIRSSSTLDLLETPGQRVQIPAADRVEVRFLARARTAGEARVQGVAASGPHGDAALATFPVLTPATTEAFATYGSLYEDDVVLQALQVPQAVYSQFGGLDIQTSSTRLQALTDAFLYLVTYRFACTEQLASRLLSVLALYDVLEAFDAPDLPSPETLRAALQGWTDQIARNQRGDGGFGFWEGSQHSWAYVSIHATYALWMAREAGLEVPPNTLSRATNFISNTRYWTHHNYSPRAQATLEAYALYVRHRSGSGSSSEVDNLITSHGIETFSMEALGWLLPLVQGTRWEERALQRIQNQVQETAATAEFQETYDAGAYQLLHTTRRTDGVVLDGLLQTDPSHYLVEKIVQGLLGHRSRGRWSNTQENVFILMALRRYFDEYESDEPDFIARAWLGDDQVGEHTFRGRTTDRYQTSVPMSFLHQGPEELPVVLQRDGQGRMYYRMGVRYAPLDRDLPPLDEGFTVSRTYHAVDDDDDVRLTEDGWEVKAGARVRVELSMTVPARRYHVALVDWLPAGFEPINTALAVSQVESGLTGGSRTAGAGWWWWWGGRWFEHENLRDERVEAFSSIIHQGVYTYSYVARATTPGEFIAMPARAEEMYHPETFGRSATETVRVLAE